MLISLNLLDTPYLKVLGHTPTPNRDSERHAIQSSEHPAILDQTLLNTLITFQIFFQTLSFLTSGSTWSVSFYYEGASDKRTIKFWIFMASLMVSLTWSDIPSDKQGIYYLLLHCMSTFFSFWTSLYYFSVLRRFCVFIICWSKRARR